MNVRSIALVASVLLATVGATPAFASYETTADLQTHCDNSDMTCMLYIAGAYDSLSSMNAYYHGQGQKGFYCSATDLTHGTVEEITRTYMREHPEAANNLAADTVMMAVANAFPCR